MHVFYTPDIQTHAELPEEEAAHAVTGLTPASRRRGYADRRKGLLLSR